MKISNTLHLYEILQKEDEIEIKKAAKEKPNDKKKEVKGIVTMEDIIETLLGYEIMDETDTIEDMQAYAKKRMQNMKCL